MQVPGCLCQSQRADQTSQVHVVVPEGEVSLALGWHLYTRILFYPHDHPEKDGHFSPSAQVKKTDPQKLGNFGAASKGRSWAGHQAPLTMKTELVHGAAWSPLQSAKGDQDQVSLDSNSVTRPQSPWSSHCPALPLHFDLQVINLHLPRGEPVFVGSAAHEQMPGSAAPTK